MVKGERVTAWTEDFGALSRCHTAYCQIPFLVKDVKSSAYCATSRHIAPNRKGKFLSNWWKPCCAISVRPCERPDSCPRSTSRCRLLADVAVVLLTLLAGEKSEGQFFYCFRCYAIIHSLKGAPYNFLVRKLCASWIIFAGRPIEARCPNGTCFRRLIEVSLPVRALW